MFALLRSLLSPFLSLMAMMMGCGLFNTFISVRLEMEGFNPEEIGITVSAMYVGILVGSFYIDRLIVKIGHVRSFIVFAATLGSLGLLQALWIDWLYWSAMRFLGGICTAGIFIVIESWLLMQASAEKRGVILSIYLAVFYAALSLGQLLIDLSDPAGVFPFYISAFLVFASILPISLSRGAKPQLTSEKSARLHLIQLYRICPLGFIGGIISGVLLAAVYGLGPIYAKEMGLSLSQIGTFMAVLIFGGFSLQWPIGHLADKSDRRRILNMACFATALFSLAIGLIGHISSWVLLPLAWLFGGFSFTLYPLSMAYTCEKVKEEQIVAATGGFVLSYSLGAIAGPLLAPIAMAWLGSAGLFYFLALITFMQGAIGLRWSAPAMVDEE